MSGRPKSEIELLRASLDGSTQAFEAVVSRYQSLVCAITYSATGNVQSSEELAQEAFLQAWKCLGQLQDLGKFRAWLCSIARSTVQNWFRSHERDVVGRAVPLEAAADKVADGSGPEEVVMVEEQQAVVRQALARMPEGLREPLILFYREGRSTREVAKLLGLSENATRQRISRGRGLLREQVADMIETTIARTRPGKAFTTAVVASIVGAGIKGSATATAAAGVASGISALTAKAAAVAVSAAVIVSGIVAYKHLNKPADAPGRQAVVLPVRQEPLERPVPAATAARSDAAPAVAQEPTGASETPITPPSSEAQPGPEASLVGRDRASVTVDEKNTFEFKPRGVLSGRITDIETGEPVRDARLSISMGRVHTARTDVNGFYCLETIEKAGDFRVAVLSQEYVGIPDDDRNSLLHLDPVRQTVKHFQLPKACMVDVWVVDANELGIKDARVVSTSLADDRSREINRSVFSSPRTDPNGYVLLGGFPPAETDYVLTVWHTVDTGIEQRGNIRRTRSECDYAPASTTVRLTDPNVVVQIRMVLDRGRTVSARAEYEDGQPAANTEIGLRPTWWHCTYALPGYTTDENGAFTIKHITPGLYDVSVSTPTGDSGFVSRKVMQAQLPPADGESLVVRLTGKSPSSWVSISGSLVFRGETRPSYVNVEAYSRTGRFYYGRVERASSSGREDTFTVDRLEPGSYTLTFSGDGIEETRVPNVIAPSSALRVELLCVPKPRLAGCVVDARTGEAIKDFRVRVKKLRTLRGSPYVQTNRWVHYENEEGAFNLDVTGPGVYLVQALAEGYAPAWSEQLNTDEPTPATVALSAGGAISGRVVDEEGKPVDGAKVIPLSLAGGTMLDTEDVFVGEEGAVETADGTFMLRGVAAGVETLKVMHPSYAPQVVSAILVAEGRHTEAVNIVLTRGGTIEGCVYDLQGKPQAGQLLYVQDAVGPGSSIDAEAGRLGQAVTDANGYYRIDHLPQQLCHVKRMNDSQELGVVCRAVVPRNGRVLRVDLGGVPVVRGRVVFDGVPATKTRLMIGPARAPHMGAFRCYAVTDEQGNFTFGGAPPGSYSIQCERRSEQVRWLPVGTIAVRDEDTDAGTLPANVSDLLVTLNDTGTAGEWSIESVSLSTGPGLWSASAGIAESPATPGDPYVIRHIQPGRYDLTIKRRDQVCWRKTIELDRAHSRLELPLDLPAWKASVSVRMQGAGARTFVLCREQKDVVALLQPDQSGVCHVSHLPAGQYWIGDISSALYDLPPITRFGLQEQEEKLLNLDLSTAQAGQTGFVIVQAVDEAGWLCDAARIQLEGPLGPVEPLPSADTGRGPGFLTVPGPHTLQVRAAGYQAAARTLNVKPFDPQLARPQTVVICLDRQ